MLLKRLERLATCICLGCSHQLSNLTIDVHDSSSAGNTTFQQERMRSNNKARSNFVVNMPDLADCIVVAILNPKPRLEEPALKLRQTFICGHQSDLPRAESGNTPNAG